MASVFPHCLSMLVAREVHLDRATGQASILGVVHRIIVSGVPATHPGVVIWAELTGGRGVVVLTVTAMRLDRRTMDEHVITTVQLKSTFMDPHEVHFVDVTLADIPLTEPGMILFRLACDGIAIMERSVQVIVAGSEKTHES